MNSRITPQAKYSAYTIPQNGEKRGYITAFTGSHLADAMRRASRSSSDRHVFAAVGISRAHNVVYEARPVVTIIESCTVGKLRVNVVRHAVARVGSR